MKKTETAILVYIGKSSDPRFETAYIYKELTETGVALITKKPLIESIKTGTKLSLEIIDRCPINGINSWYQNSAKIITGAQK